jgi:hypothetical protein
MVSRRKRVKSIKRRVSTDDGAYVSICRAAKMDRGLHSQSAIGQHNAGRRGSLQFPQVLGRSVLHERVTAHLCDYSGHDGW